MVWDGLDGGEPEWNGHGWVKAEVSSSSEEVISTYGPYHRQDPKKILIEPDRSEEDTRRKNTECSTDMKDGGMTQSSSNER